ncbi:hypothetical protein G6F57_022721 [Rhizopus arrhizus]|nr:hypothetical protein G6F57_022721 [Rhizopus arrhizus]
MTVSYQRDQHLAYDRRLPQDLLRNCRFQRQNSIALRHAYPFRQMQTGTDRREARPGFTGWRLALDGFAPVSTGQAS